MKPEQYEESAQRIIDDDGAAGVALLMADHTRCLEQLRAIYDEAAPRQVADRGAEVVAATVRDLALRALRMPTDLRDRLFASGRPAVTEGDRMEVEIPTFSAPPSPRTLEEFDAWLSMRGEFGEVLRAFRQAFGTDTSAAAMEKSAAAEESAEDAARRFTRAFPSRESLRRRSRPPA
jgi:hypothetical protein